MPYLCPICNKPLKCIYDRPGFPREFACEVAMKGLFLGKIGDGYKHQKAYVYTEKISENKP